MSLNNKRIAILEDDPAQAELLQSWLKEAGFSYQLYTNGKSLTRALKNESFDLMILDWELPDTTGVEIVRHIRDTINWHIPVLFTTNRDSEEDIVTALEAGADDYLIKPLPKAETFARLNALSRRLNAANQVNEEQITFPPYQLIHHTLALNLLIKVCSLPPKNLN
jgi:DNA-binding response OmpR family regulator